MDDVRFQGSVLKPLASQLAAGTNIPELTFMGNSGPPAFHRRMNLAALRSKGIRLTHYSETGLNLFGLPEANDPIHVWLEKAFTNPKSTQPLNLRIPLWEKSGSEKRSPLSPSARLALWAGSGTDENLGTSYGNASRETELLTGVMLTERLRSRIAKG